MQLGGSHLPHSPEPFDRKRVKEGQLFAGWHHQKTVGFGHCARHLCQELGAGNPDRDRQPDLLQDSAPQSGRDLDGGARNPAQSPDIEKGLIDGQPLDQRRRVVKQIKDRLACFGVGRDPGRDNDGMRTQPAGHPATHRPVDAIGPGLVAGRQNHPGPDHYRTTPQPRIVTLLDRRVEGVEIGMKDRRLRPHRTYVRPRDRRWQAIPTCPGRQYRVSLSRRR